MECLANDYQWVSIDFGNILKFEKSLTGLINNGNEQWASLIPGCLAYHSDKKPHGTLNNPINSFFFKSINALNKSLPNQRNDSSVTAVRWVSFPLKNYCKR